MIFQIKYGKLLFGMKKTSPTVKQKSTLIFRKKSGRKFRLDTKTLMYNDNQ